MEGFIVVDLGQMIVAAAHHVFQAAQSTAGGTTIPKGRMRQTVIVADCNRESAQHCGNEGDHKES